VIALDAIRDAREALRGVAVRTPLVRLNADTEAEVWLKLENLQPIGSFKLRGAYNAIRLAAPEERAAGVVTVSAGNMAQGVAWAARELGIPCTVIVPEHAPETKLAAIERLGGRYVKVDFATWWQTMETSRFEGVDGLFVHPVQDEAVMAGNGTIGLELLDDLPDVDIVLTPFGGGGLTVGIASAVKAERPEVEVYACEPETAAPLGASLAAGSPQEVEYTPSFVDGAGGRTVLEPMWPRVREVVDGALTVTLDETARAVRVLAERNRVVAEGAAGLPVAAALEGRVGGPGRRIACVVSGGNIDAARLAAILSGETPA
jgi:threonine dehydratase